MIESGTFVPSRDVADSRIISQSSKFKGDFSMRLVGLVFPSGASYLNHPGGCRYEAEAKRIRSSEMGRGSPTAETGSAGTIRLKWPSRSKFRICEGPPTISTTKRL